MGSTSDTSVSFVTSVRLTPDEHKTLKRIAAADKRSLSNELRYLIERRADELAAPTELRDAA
jgi:hypothetical protein